MDVTSNCHWQPGALERDRFKSQRLETWYALYDHMIRARFTYRIDSIRYDLALRGSSGLAFFCGGRSLRTLGAVLGIVALLLQVSSLWVPYSALAVSDEGHGNVGIAAFLDAGLTLCGAHAASQEQTSVPGTVPLSGKSALCPICLALHLLNSAVTPTNTFVLAGSAFDVAFVSLAHESIAAHSLHPTAQPRAPPTRLT
jgi:hypothetical protein